MQSGLMPLFPLQVVVFPRTPLPLHIFEERYKEMVGEAIRNQTEFGIVLAKEENLASVGCTVVVDRVLKEYPDGRMDIVASGRRRFEILALNDEKPYLRGEVQFFDDDESRPAPGDVQHRALVEYRRLLQLIRKKPRPFAEPAFADPQLSFQLGQIVEDLEFLQTLLQSRSEAERLRKLADYLIEFVPKEQHSMHVRRVAPLNGHGRKNIA